nr:hypothetical protein [Tanacetum cinerariifolium]
ERLAEGTEGAPHLGLERPCVYSDLSPEEKDRYNADIMATNILLQGLPKDIYTFINHYTDAKDTWDSGRQNRGQGTNPWGRGAAGYGGVQNIVRNANSGQARQVKCYNCNSIGHIARNCTQPKHLLNSNYYKDKMLLMQAQENGVALDKEQLLFLAGGQDNAINEDVDEQPAPTAQTMFMANLSSADPIYDEAGPSYDSDMLSEYVKDNMVPGVHSNASSIPNDAYIMTYNDMYEPHAQSVSKTSQNTVVENPLTAELATYKEQVERYKRRARFKLTERKQNINEQFRIVITDRNFKEETLKKEIHSVKLQLHSTINHNKLMVEKVTSLKKVFKQKENKYLEDFLDMKSLKEKVKDILFKQDQSLQTVHMFCRPKPYYNELNKEHFEGIQKSLTKEIKEMKDVFEELEAEVAQNVVDRKHDEIKRKNLLITNDNLIAECLSKEVFYVATNFDLNVARFTEMYVANTIVEARYLELEAELSTLHSFGNNPPTPAKDTLDFDSVFVIRKVQASLQGKDNVIKQLKKKIPHLQETRSKANRTLNHYKELYDSIKIMRAKHIEQVTALTTKNVNLKAQILNMVNSISKDHVKTTVLVPGKYAIDVEPIPSRLRNDRDAYLDYLRHLKESVETIREIVEEAKVVRPLDSLIVSTFRYTKHSQELLEYAIGTFIQDSYQRDKKHAPVPLIRKKQVSFVEQYDTSNSNTHKHVVKLNTQKTNVPVPPSTGVNRCTDASGSQLKSNTKKNRISPAKGVNKMQVEEQPRTNKSHLRTLNRVDSSSRSKSTIINLNSDSVCQTCNECLISTNHDMCVVDYLQSVVPPPSIRNNCNVARKVKQV